MFAKATRKFVDEIDPDGCLIPVYRLNESDNLNIFSLVIKRKPFWFWQEPKYMPTDFTLNDVLVGENPINPVVIETEFLNYKRTAQNNSTGGAEADFGNGNVNIGGKGSSKLASSFGRLKKQEVDVQQLLRDSKDRSLDFQHSLLRQARQHEVFTLVKERIITTQTCTVTEEKQNGGNCAGFLGLPFPKKIQVSVKNGSILSDSNVFLEIPGKTALAYCLMELSVKKTGQFELCLRPDTSGCFEVDGLKATNTTLLCSDPPESPVQKLHEDLEQLQVHFKVLSEIPESTRSCLFQQITLLLKDKKAILTLDLALKDLLCGRKPDISTLDKVPPLKKAVQTTLELLTEKEGANLLPMESAITATSILTSALEGMTVTALTVLESCCHLPTLQALHLLVQNLMANKVCSLKDSTLTPLAQNDTYSKVQELFESSSVTLSKEEEDLIQAQINSQHGHFPLILCIAIIGLTSLASPADQVSGQD